MAFERHIPFFSMLVQAVTLVPAAHITSCTSLDEICYLQSPQQHILFELLHISVPVDTVYNTTHVLANALMVIGMYIW